METNEDKYFMGEALKEARRAYDLGEVPIGCVITKDGEIIARGANERATKKNALHHAEITAINQACEAIGDWRLEDCRIYVTIEPCPMCAGAIIQARIPVVIYGAKNPKAGCAGSILNILEEPKFNHQAQVITGVCEDECASIMREFFQRFR
ncbi:MAG: tRNA adenosine(34) deaminase TadA [Defluviitaleaceae bacterium]|nr:tRNA adenosine(34) deaminase TadA [Defluviitaleaceae bacterium]